MIADRGVVVLDPAALHDDDAVAQPLDLEHVVRGEQDGGAVLLAIGLRDATRIQSAVSGSSEAVGSSSSSSSGRLISALASATRVFWPADSLPLARSRNSPRSRSAASSAIRSRRFWHRVEPAEHGEVLPHRQPHRHVDIGAFEIHPAEHVGALLRHRAAEHPDAARGRQHQPHDHRDRGGLAGAVAAEQPGDAAARDRERDVVDRARRSCRP